MKSVLISIQPKWCELIASGEKTIEVRKTAPQMPLPFKCYIYCTKSRKPYESFGVNNRPVECGGYVIGKFECKDVLNFTLDPYGHHEYFISDDDLEASCLTEEDLWDYGKGKTLYGWYIYDLVIYDEPKPLSNFIKCHYPWECGVCDYYDSLVLSCDKPKRPPQSWCYVEV